MHSSGTQLALLMGGVLAFCALAVGACGAPKEAAKPRPLPEYTRELDPGTYRTEEFEPRFSFRVGESWRHLPMEESDDLALARGQRLLLRFFEAREVYKPNERYDIVEAPDDPVGWLRRHPFLRASAPRTVTVGGIEGEQIDVAVIGNPPEGHRVGACGPECVGLFRLGDGTALGVPKGEKVREIVLEDVEGATVIIGFGSPANEFDALAVPKAMEVINTVEWRSS